MIRSNRVERSYKTGAGQSIVQVTHSEVNAAYGTRIIQLHDGWLVEDTANSSAGRAGEAIHS
jgi:ABC-type lipoprotein export system ATPase subunit